MQIDALAFSWAGDKYLGFSYQKMDCQAFVEKCMADCGYRRDLAGSNAWYRVMDWTGTPEECMRQFGSVPKGALLFILKQDGKEPDKYKPDGRGNASHIGIKTGRGEGAIHSSSSRGCVCESKFKDKTIPNGGWNTVGLLKAFDYGKSINWILDHSGSQGTDKGDDGTVGDRFGYVWAENGKPVNLRKTASKDAPLVDKIPVGESVQIVGESGDWYKLKVNGMTGWMMKEFVKEDEADDFPDVPNMPDDGEHTDLLVEIYNELGKIREKIENAIGRG